VLTEFMALFPATIELALCAILFALVLGIPAGILAAVKRNSVLDHGVMGVSLTGYSMPIFWWGPASDSVFFGPVGFDARLGADRRQVFH